MALALCLCRVSVSSGCGLQQGAEVGAGALAGTALALQRSSCGWLPPPPLRAKQLLDPSIKQQGETLKRTAGWKLRPGRRAPPRTAGARAPASWIASCPNGTPSSYTPRRSPEQIRALAPLCWHNRVGVRLGGVRCQRRSHALDPFSMSLRCLSKENLVRSGLESPGIGGAEWRVKPMHCLIQTMILKATASLILHLSHSTSPPGQTCVFRL